jgi:hypothetical protein
LVSGGYVLEDEDGNNIPPRQAGPEVLALLQDQEFLGFMSMNGLTAESQSGEPFLSPNFLITEFNLIQVSTCH